LLLLLVLSTSTITCLDNGPRCYKGHELNALLSKPCEALKDVDKVLCETGTCHDLGRSLPKDAVFCCCSEKHPCLSMKSFFVIFALFSTATALHCFVGTLLTGSFNKLPSKDCGDIEACINGTVENDDGGVFMAGCDHLVLQKYGVDKQYNVTCPKGEPMNSCHSVDLPAAPAADGTNITSRATVCCCDDEWCNKGAYGLHSLAVTVITLITV
ncbi:hypothetical protein PFISCL1PPCAC_16548, partial [Pristionchus fissidentatus]